MLLGSKYSFESLKPNLNQTYKVEDENSECLVVNSIFDDPSKSPEREENIELRHAVKKSATKIFFDSSKPESYSLSNNEDLLTNLPNSEMDLDEATHHAVKKSATKIFFEEHDIEGIKKKKIAREFDSQSIGTSQETDCSNTGNNISPSENHHKKSKKRKVGKKINGDSKDPSDIKPPRKKLKISENPQNETQINDISDSTIQKVKGTKKRLTITQESNESENFSDSIPKPENQSNTENGENILTEDTRNEVISKICPEKGSKKKPSRGSKNSKNKKSKVSKDASKPQKIEPPKPPQEIPIGDRISAWNQLKSGYANKRKIPITKSEYNKGEYQNKYESEKEQELRIFDEDIQLMMQNNEPGTLSDLLGRIKALLRDKAQASLNSYIIDGNKDLWILFGKREILYDDLSNLVLNNSSAYIEERDWRKRVKLDKDGKENNEADY